MKVIGFCGLPGAGKSSAIEAVRDLGEIITMGDVIRNEAKIRNLDPTSENLGKIAKDLRQKGGPNIVAEKCVEFIQQQKNNVIFIDGLRSMAEVTVFKRKWRFPIIAITLDEVLRFKRLAHRGRSDDPKNILELRERDEREVGFGVKDVIKNADYHLENTSSEEELKKKTNELVLQILKNY